MPLPQSPSLILSRRIDFNLKYRLVFRFATQFRAQTQKAGGQNTNAW